MDDRFQFASERLPWLGFQLARGERFTVMELAERTGLTRSGAAKALERASLAIPITVIGTTEHGAEIWAAIDSSGEIEE